MNTLNQPDHDSGDPDSIADSNVEQLLSRAYHPEVVDAEFGRRVEDAIIAEARRGRPEREPRPSADAGKTRSPRRWERLLGLAVAISLIVVASFIWLRRPRDENHDVGEGPAAVEENRPREFAAHVEQGDPKSEYRPIGDKGLVPRRRPAPPNPMLVRVGTQIETHEGERRRLSLPDQSILYINECTRISLDADRRLTLHAGEVFLEVAQEVGQASSLPKVGQVSNLPGRLEAYPTEEEPGPVVAQTPVPAKFVIRTPDRDVTALGTKFAVRVGEAGTGVLVTQGKVQVSGLATPVVAGQQVEPQADAGSDPPPVSTAPRASHLLDWTRDLMIAAESPLVPDSKFSGGALVAVDPNGQERKLSLRKYHVDVYIEDGFARTTIDQTYFNHEPWRMEGTFYFPLPPDASLSRLAMYVGGKLMEGGMAERDYARQVFETIKYRRLDPALLEWIDGSTFKMRVFPLEGRQEKRIVLSYTQKLRSSYGLTRYRFPAGHSLKEVGDWSTRVQVADGVGRGLDWKCPSHEMEVAGEGCDLVLAAQAERVKPDKDIVVELRDRSKSLAGIRSARFSTALHEGAQYLAIRYRPELMTDSRPRRRDWIFLCESSGDRNPLLARVQVDIIRTLLENAEHNDTFTILTAGTRVRALSDVPLPATPENVARSMTALDSMHLIGALDLEQALAAAGRIAEKADAPVLVHLGSGVPVLGERREDKLLEMLPFGTEYVGVGVGKRFNRNFMKTAAGRTGGYCTQINPDEPVGWRAFELLCTLNTPRLLDVKVTPRGPGKEQAPMLPIDDVLIHGDELCAIGRFESGAELPSAVALTGTLGGEPFECILPVPDGIPIGGHLPRIWAKLEIDRLLAKDAEKNKDQIIALSKAMYVMSPFTSLLVLENDEMYEQYKVDRGRKDHWALYPCPEQIKVVYEPLPVEERSLEPDEAKPDYQRLFEPNEELSKPLSREVMRTILVRTPPPLFQAPYGRAGGGHTSSVWRLLYRPYANYYGPYLPPRITLWNGQMPFQPQTWGTLPPRLSRVPFVSRLFSNGNDDTANSLMMMATPRIIIQEEEEELLGIPPPEWYWGRVNINQLTMDSRLWRQPLLRGGGYGSHRLPDPSNAEPLVRVLQEAINGDPYEFDGRRGFGDSDGPIDLAALEAYLWLSRHPSVEGSWNLDNDWDGAPGATALALFPFIGGRSSRPTGVGSSQADFDRLIELITSTITPTTWVDVGGPGAIEGFETNLSLVISQSQEVHEGSANLWYHAPLSSRYVPDLNYSADSRLGYLDPADPFGSHDWPVTYPDPSVWEGLTLRRRKFASIKLAKQGSLVRKILRALDERAHLPGYPMSLRDVAEYLTDLHAIEIELDTAALAAAGVDVAVPVAHAYSGKTLREGLRRMVRQLGLGYVVWDEYILITTPEQVDRLSMTIHPVSGVRLDQHQSHFPQRCLEIYHPGQRGRIANLILWRMRQAGGQPDPLYQPPELTDNDEVFRDLAAFAPAMNTTRADVLATLDREARLKNRPKPGHVDGRARELIEKSRRQGWQTVSWKAADDEDPPLIVQADGSGRYRYERTTIHGLREIVLCDDSTLRHIYPELGIGAKRTMGAFYRSEILGLVPWLVPPVDELALGADLRAVGRQTVEVVPHGLEKLVEALRNKKKSASDPEQEKGQLDEKGNDDQKVRYTLVHLVFSETGRLAERRLIEMPARKTLLKICYGPDGTARWIGKDNKERGGYKLEVADVDPPELVPDASKFVLLPMPRRTEQHIRKTMKPRSEPDDENAAEVGEFANLSESEAVELIAANLHGDFVKLREIIEQRFFQRGDHRIGLYTLLLSSLPRREHRVLHNIEASTLLGGRGETRPADTETTPMNKPRPPISPDDDPDSSPLDRYIAWQLSKEDGHEVEPLRFDNRQDGFIQQLATFQYYYRAITERKIATVDASRQGQPTGNSSATEPTWPDVFAFIRNCNSPAFALVLLRETTVFGRGGRTTLGAIAAAYYRLEQQGYSSYALRYERACTLYRIGRDTEARKAFEKLYRDAIQRGGLPPVDTRFVNAFKKSGPSRRKWEHLLNETCDTLVDQRRYAQVFLLLSQCRQLGEDSFSRELLSRTLASVGEEDRFAVTLMAVADLVETEQHRRADSMLKPLLDDEAYNDLPELWQLAAEVADQSGMLARSLACEENALDLALGKLTDKVDVTQIRGSHGKLLNRYEELAYAVATLGDQPSTELVGRVVRIADRWRSFDDDATGPCQAAAKVLQAVGEERLAWDYLTTPLALKPNEAVAWQSLAETLGNDQQYELADRAYAAAFEAEPTNAKLLWDRIELLQEAGRRDEANKLLKQLAEGNWQSRFQHLQKKATNRISQ